MGSIKDRIARFMVNQALESGDVAPGGTVIESSSGNTAMGLAMMAVLKDLKCTMVVRQRTSKEKLDCLRAMGVDLVLVDGLLPPGDPESYNQKARRLAAENPDWWFPDQHNNRLNSEAHYRPPDRKFGNKWTVELTHWLPALERVGRSVEQRGFSRNKTLRSGLWRSIRKGRFSSTGFTTGVWWNPAPI